MVLTIPFYEDYLTSMWNWRYDPCVTLMSTVIFSLLFVTFKVRLLLWQTWAKLAAIGYMLSSTLPKHMSKSVSRVRVYLHDWSTYVCTVHCYNGDGRRCLYRCSTTTQGISSCYKWICEADVCVYIILCLQSKQRTSMSTRYWWIPQLTSVPSTVPY